jgi:hypothetical protein
VAVGGVCCEIRARVPRVRSDGDAGAARAGPVFKKTIRTATGKPLRYSSDSNRAVVYINLYFRSLLIRSTGVQQLYPPDDPRDSTVVCGLRGPMENGWAVKCQVRSAKYV